MIGANYLITNFPKELIKEVLKNNENTLEKGSINEVSGLTTRTSSVSWIKNRNTCQKVFSVMKKQAEQFSSLHLDNIEPLQYSEYGNDAPAHLLFFYLISITLKDKLFDTKEILNLLIISLFVVLNKIILLFSVFIVLIHFTKKHFLNFFKNKRFYFLVLFFLIWVIKNIAISGCLIFPITKLCSESLLWSNKSISKSVSIENEAWAKGWPDYVNDKNTAKEDKLTMKNYSTL